MGDASFRPLSLTDTMSSLEDILVSGPTQLLSESRRSLAHQKFYQIVGHFDTGDASPADDTTYNHPRLIRLTYEYALSDASRDLFLQAFFRSIQIPLDDLESIGDSMEHMRSDVFGFAEYLMDNFFLPLLNKDPDRKESRASTRPKGTPYFPASKATSRRAPKKGLAYRATRKQPVTAIKKKRRNKPGTVVLREIRRY
ncbi:hypothetical protein ACRALDRAFT_1083780 [Sodiomyces alcalophilus JCM 7366]|uniref:uncharacterized protein n=1 Tax=Sodiomyces alcalophilus JCM 7366 TaxID=591952 RepID=UPI0039B648A2